MSKLLLSIDGMACNHCTASVTSAITALNGVESADVSLEEKSAAVVYDSSKVTADAIADVVDELGFTVTCKQEI